MKVLTAVMELLKLGYHFELAGDRLRYGHERPENLDPAQIRPLLALVKENKAEVIDYLVRKTQTQPERILTCDKTFGVNGSALSAPNGFGVPEKNFPTEIIILTSSGKKFRFQCSSETKGDEKKPPINLDEVRRVLEDAVEAAEERSAIMEHDGGLKRQEADETARVLHIQPAIDDLLRRGLVSIEGGVPGAQMSAPPSAKPAKVAKLQPVEAPQTSPPACTVTCAACPWYELNPWTHDPALGAWCHYRREGLVLGSASCEEFNRGEVPPRQNHEPVPQVQLSKSPTTQEGVLTCADCPHFEPNHGPNPRQGWGKCLKRGRGRYGSATACEAALDFKGDNELEHVTVI